MLKVSELEDGKFYRCSLSCLIFVCNFVPAKWIDTQEGRIVTDYNVVCRYFDPTNGVFHDIIPFDNQFTV